MKRKTAILAIILIIIAASVIGFVIKDTSVNAPSTQQSSLTPSTKTGQNQTANQPSRCSADDLTGSLAIPDGGAAAGNRYYTLTLTNHTDKICTLSGYPGISLTDGSGSQVGDPADKDTSIGATTISLGANQSAIATIKLSVAGNYPEGVCKDGVATLKAYPPDDTGYLLVPTDSVSITSWCPGFTTTTLSKS